MVYGYTGYNVGSNITFDGPNLLNVTLDADDSLMNPTTEVSNFQDEELEDPNTTPH